MIDEKYYIANIALLTANVAGKTKNMAETIVDAGTSASTFGFNFDIQMDIDALEQETIAIMASCKASNINTDSSLLITSGGDTTIEGSNINAADNINIAAANINITAGRNTSESSSDLKHAHTTVTYALHGGLGVNAEADTTTSTGESASYSNSKLNSSDISITSVDDTTIEGAVVKAEDNLDLEVGGDLIVKSLQDTYKDRSYTLGASGGYSYGSKPANSQASDPTGNAGASFSITNGAGKWVEEQTQLLAGNNVNITVENSTILKGAVISSDVNHLILETGSLEYADIRDKDKSSTIGGGLSYSQEYGTKSNGAAKESENGFNASLGFADKSQLNRAVIGAGDIIIRDNPEQDLSGLKRDTAYAQVQTKDTGVLLEVDKDILNVLVNPIQAAKDIKTEIKDASHEIAIGYNTIKNNLFNETVVKDLVKKIKEADNNYKPSEADKIILAEMEQVAQEAGYDLKNMSIKEKLTVFDKLSKKAILTDDDKKIRDIIWYNMGNQPEWECMREDQQEDIISALVKDSMFWRGKVKWNDASYSEEEQKEFLKYVSDKEADAIEMRRVDLKLYKDKQNIGGQYEPVANLTEINRLSVTYPNFYSVIKTVSHETAGHGYQYYIIKNKDDFLKENFNLEDQVKIFKYSFDPKMGPGEGYGDTKIKDILYLKDPTEIDAFNMGNSIETGVKK